MRKQGKEAFGNLGNAGCVSEENDLMVADVLTTEFDVFACDAFVEDQGKWLRLMPDAGFVPT